MNTRRVCISALASVLAIAAGPAAALADAGTSPVRIHTERGEHVFQRITHDLDNGCQYRVTVRGQLAEQSGTELYSADLVVAPSLQCPGETAIREPARVVRFHDLRHDIAEAHIEIAASVTHDEAMRHCRYQPTFGLGRNYLRTHDVTASCTYLSPYLNPYGGGPR